MTVKWIAERLQMGTPGHVNHLLYRERKGKILRYANIKNRHSELFTFTFMDQWQVDALYPMNPTKQQVLEVLAALRERKLSFEAFQREFNRLINDGVLGSFQSFERSRLSEFIGYLDACDPDAIPRRTFGSHLKMIIKAGNGERAYPKEQVIEEAHALEQCLLGNETRWQRLRRFFSVR